MIDPSLLPTFVAVARAGRISAAARSLHLSQPAVTAQVQRLEQALGTPLFVRSPRGVDLTAAGERLLGYAREVRRLLDEAETTLGDRHESGGELLLGASTTIAAYVLPPVLAAFRAAYPSVSLRLEVANTERVLAGVVGGELPLGLVEGHARAPGVRLEPFVDDELVVVTARHSRFRVRTLADLARVPLLWREPGSGTRAVVERALRRAGVRRAPLGDDVELASNEAIVGSVAADLGVAVASRWVLRAHLALGEVVIVPGLDFVVRRTFRFALPPGGAQGLAAQFVTLGRRSPPVL